MKVLEVRNVNEALPLGVRMLVDRGVEEDSRNGKVLVFPSPVTTVYNKPTERVMLYDERDANPFFHLYESLWMLAGQDEVHSVGFFAKNMFNYSDNGETLHGAYGHRWRERFHVDQLDCLVTELSKNPESRRCVLQMWDSAIDLNNFSGKDVPCNTQVYFWIRDAVLHMTVTCRSNDIVWGAYGANAVHFSVLLEYMAARLGIRVGRLYQISNNYHIYKDNPVFPKAVAVAEVHPFGTAAIDLYRYRLNPYPMFDTMHGTDIDLEIQVLVEQVQIAYAAVGAQPLPNRKNFKSLFFQSIAVPMMRAYMLYKVEASHEHVLDELEHMPVDSDWFYACTRWMNKRYNKEEETP